MQSGKLRHRIILQRPTISQDSETGLLDYGWITFGKAWAQVRSLNAKEFIDADAEHSEVSVKILIRARADVDHTCRILFRGKIFNIFGILADSKSGLESQTLLCGEGVNDG